MRDLDAGTTALPLDSRDMMRLRIAARAAALFTVGIGFLVLIGWVLEIPFLQSVVPGFVAMVPNTAVGFVLAGLSLWLQVNAKTAWGRLESRAAAAAAGLLGLLTLAEYLWRKDLQIDELLFRDSAGLTSVFPGRMAVTTASAFVAVAVALLMPQTRRARWLAEALALVPGSLALISLTGYVYGVHSFYWIGNYKGMAIHTALAFLALSLGVLLSGGGLGFSRLIVSDTVGGAVVRRILPVALVVPLLLGWLGLIGQRLGFYDAEFGRALDAVSEAFVLVAVVLWIGTALMLTDDKRKRSENALQQSEQRFSLAFNASPISTTISEIETDRILDANDRFLEVSGYSKDEVIGKTSVELGLWVRPEDRERVAARVQRGGSIRDEEAQICTRAGEIRDVVGSATRIDVGGLPCVLSTFRDVTDRRQAEKEMRRSEERFRRLFESNTIGIVIANLAGETLEANDVYLSMLGYTRDELISGRIRWRQLTPPEQLERDWIAIEQLQRTGVAPPWEKELLRKDGTRVPVLIGIAMLGEAEGNCLAYIVDLSGRRQAEEALRASEESYRLLFESNPQPMWAFDEKTLGFLEVNEAACRHYGYSREELLGMTIEDIRPADDVPALRRLLETESRVHQHSGIWRHRKKDGTIIEVEISSNPIVLDGRRAQLVLATDVTERRMLEHQLYLAQKMEAVGQLAGGIAHDFNNLLTAILGYADILSSQVGEGSPASESVAEIRKAGERAASLTRQLLAFSRRQVLEPKMLDLNALVENLENMLRRLIGEDVELVRVLDPGIGLVLADAGQLEQVVMNLAVNARDAMPKGGALTIETKDVELDEAYAREHRSARPGRYVMLAVSDTGLGMSAETKSHMFEPFFTTKMKGKGTGLGLATVYGIVKQSGGHIWVYSEPDRGTSFKVYLPRVDGAVDVAATRQVPQRQTGGSETLLLVEDEQAVRALVRRILESYGYTVIEAGGAAQALEAARSYEGPIHLILTDVVMPEMGGSELAPRVAELRPDVRVLFMSGYTDDAVLRQGLIAEGGHFLQKPFTPDALARKVRDVLEREP